MKILRIFFLLFLSVIIWLAVCQYFFCPQFNFIKGKPFAGNHLYNPYAGMDAAQWIKCNFHAHTNAWQGITNGHGTAADVARYYDSLGYAVHCVSDYQKINELFSNQRNYIPAYEHGYNIQKAHQLVLGNYSVRWLDYIFPQTLSNKQWIINRLSEDSDNVIVLNHPAMRGGFNEDDLEYLTNYQCMEVLNPSVFSFAHWDAALSAGNPIFIVGDDDSHNVCNLFGIGRCCTWVNVSQVNAKNVLAALKKGNSYAMHVADKPNEKIESRIRRLKYELPRLNSFLINHDTIELSVTQMATQIKFIGQNGKILATSDNTLHTTYTFKQDDLYVRAAIRFADSTEIFLNPVFRYNGSSFMASNEAVINHNKSFIFFCSGLVILCVWAFFVLHILSFKFLKRKSRWRVMEKTPVAVPV